MNESKLREASDEQLIELCRNQLPYTTSAFEALLQRYESLVFRTCWRFLGNREEAEEATQDVFLRVFHGLAGFEGRSTFRTWLFRVVHNVWARRRARMAREIRKHADYEAATLTTNRAAGSVRADDLASGVLAQLSAEDRQVIVLRYVSELSLGQVAEALDITLSAAKMRLYRAVERFRTAYRIAAGPAKKPEHV